MTPILIDFRCTTLTSSNRHLWRRNVIALKHFVLQCTVQLISFVGVQAVHMRLLKTPHSTAFTNQTLLSEWGFYGIQELAPHFSYKIEKNSVQCTWNQWFLCSAQKNVISSWVTSCTLYIAMNSRAHEITVCCAVNKKSCFRTLFKYTIHNRVLEHSLNTLFIIYTFRLLLWLT
jgi:hypothetical protein